MFWTRDPWCTAWDGPGAGTGATHLPRSSVTEGRGASLPRLTLVVCSSNRHVSRTELKVDSDISVSRSWRFHLSGPCLQPRGSGGSLQPLGSNTPGDCGTPFPQSSQGPGLRKKRRPGHQWHQDHGALAQPPLELLHPAQASQAPGARAGHQRARRGRLHHQPAPASGAMAPPTEVHPPLRLRLPRCQALASPTPARPASSGSPSSCLGEGRPVHHGC